MIEQGQENRGITWRPYKEHCWTCKRERQASYFTIIDAAGANPLHQPFNSTMLQGLLGLGTDALITTKMMSTSNSTRNMLQKHAQEQQGLQQLFLYNMPCSRCGRFHCQNISPPLPTDTPNLHTIDKNSELPTEPPIHCGGLEPTNNASFPLFSAELAHFSHNFWDKTLCHPLAII